MSKSGKAKSRKRALNLTKTILEIIALIAGIAAIVKELLTG